MRKHALSGEPSGLRENYMLDVKFRSCTKLRCSLETLCARDLQYDASKSYLQINIIPGLVDTTQLHSDSLHGKPVIPG